MANRTGISWTDATWNPIVGCSIVSPGCTNCYAQSQAARIIRCSAGAGSATHYEGTVQMSKAGPVWTGKVSPAPDSILMRPLSWRKGKRIFVNSMGDLFHDAVPDEWIDRVFAVMALAPQHQFQVLTKRARRMLEYLTGRSALDERSNPEEQIRAAMTALVATPSRRKMAPALKAIPLGKYCAKIAWPLPNVWLGVTAEDQTRANERIPDLLAAPAALRFVSVEPMLGPVDLRNITPADKYELDALSGFDFDQSSAGPRLDWVIVGGESGPAARPLHPDWARSLRDQCKAAGTPFFFKQFGAWSGQRLRTTKADMCVVLPDGTTLTKNRMLDHPEIDDAEIMMRVGTRAAGHLLDGVEHHEFPEGRNA